MKRWKKNLTDATDNPIIAVFINWIIVMAVMLGLFYGLSKVVK